MSKHPYKSGNYAPTTEKALGACTCVGVIPRELEGGMYIRNGSNPSGPATKGQELDYHWFDGDGMLAGVVFESNSQRDDKSSIVPTFVQKFVLTDVYLAKSLDTSKPIIPSIATLLAPISGLPTLIASVFRAVSLAAISQFGGLTHAIDRISVGNTSVFYHDGRALVGCESGPFGWMRLPALETVGWWDLEGDAGEAGLRVRGGALGWMKEWITAHPKRDPVTKELIMFHSSLLPPYLHYSVVPPTYLKESTTPRIISAPVPIPGPRMMHDFAASHRHSILLDMPLSLDPLNLFRGIPVVSFSPSTPSKFGIFPRHSPEAVRWYSAAACCIFHTALSYSDNFSASLLCCRLNSSRLVYAAGMLEFPASQVLPDGKEETCQLYYYRFSLVPSSPSTPTNAFPLSIVPFEFPTVPHNKSMEAAKFVYGCSMKNGSFTVALGKAAKIDCIVKIDVQTLIASGIKGGNSDEDAVDQRTVRDIISTQSERVAGSQEEEENETIRIFAMPENWYAQECSFVSRYNPRSEDDGFLLFYAFDESQLDPISGEARSDAISELWILDAWNMKDVVAKVQLPARVPYGLHGNWFTKEDIANQREVKEVRVDTRGEKFL